MAYFQDKTILIISPESWGKCRVSKHHYAAHLAKMGNQVFFLAKNQEDFLSPESGVTLLNMPQIPRGMRFLPDVIRKKFHKKTGETLRKKTGVLFDVVWSFDTSVFYDFKSCFPGSYSILHVVDLSMTFQWQIAAKQADICLGSSKIIVNRLKQLNKHSHFIHHGLAQYPTNAHAFIEKMNVVYAGNLNIKYLDRSKLEALIQHYPTVTFHFIGDTGNENLSNNPTEDYSKVLRRFPNTRFYGALAPDELRNYLLGADVLLLCYNPLFKDQISNPHKVMEYLSTGRPILSTVLDEYTDGEELFTMIDDETTYIQSLSALLAEKDESKAVARINFALKNTYELQIQRISCLIEQIN